MGELIPFNLPYVAEASKKYVSEALENNHQQGGGPFTARASKMVSDLVGGGYVHLTPSCTHSLEMASMLINLAPGDEVILPSYTFPSAAIAVTKFGAIPVFVDIETETKGINVQQVREAITPNTKAISWVNYAGVAPDIDALQEIARQCDLILIEDNAHGLGGTYKGKPLGSFGDFATQSFHATKNIQCGEGGALVINNPKFKERAEIISEKGTNRAKFVNGEIQKYEWVDQGSSYLLAEALSAILVGQLESFTWIHDKRLSLWNLYSSLLKKFEGEFEFTVQKWPQFNDRNSAHIFYIVFESENRRQVMKDKLTRLGLEASTHYQPLDTSIFGRKYSLMSHQTPLSQKLSKTLLRLPIYPSMDLFELNQIFQRLKRK